MRALRTLPIAASDVGLGPSGGWMKMVWIGLLAIVSIGTALALDRSELDQRIRMLTAKFQSLQSQPDKCVPPDILRKAEGIVLLEFDFGAEARGTAGDVSAGTERSLDKPDQQLWVYDDRRGLYGGMALKAGALTPDNEANRVYYGQFLTINDILFDKKAKPTQSSKDLAAKIAEYSNTLQNRGPNRGNNPSGGPGVPGPE